MSALKRVLQRWHWLHTWGSWKDGTPFSTHMPWTPEDRFASIEQPQTRTCTVCGIKQARTVTIA